MDLEVLYEFKAGCCQVEGKRVKPLKDKGVVQLLRMSNGNRNVIHFVWRNRNGSPLQEDHHLCLFSNEAVFREIGAGRVYLLENKVKKTKKIYWMQSGDQSLDSLIVRRVNEILSGC
mmetsp:Transcript_29693/g.41026  ORF Transcript_29693/g.41026 Transcript_29693/m.41026 type:complete len:117 (+) Transcript_29693:308-658(+)